MIIDPRAAEIVPGDVSGGANTSHTILIGALATLLDALPSGASESDYMRSALEENVLGKQTHEARRRTYRYLKELYLLRPDALLFRALRDLWSDDEEARPLLAGLCALARDPVFRASSRAIIRSRPGGVLTSGMLAEMVGESFPLSYRESTLATIGRNLFSSWEQTGHLAKGRPPLKVRSAATCTPANLAYALLLGHLEGARGQALFETLWAKVLDASTAQLFDLAFVASQHGLLELRRAGGVTEVGFHELLRPFAEESP